MPTPVLTSTKGSVTHVNCLLYGDAGVGKTFLSSTAPKPIILSAEHGLLSLADFDIPVIEVKNLQAVVDAYNFLYKGGHDFETVILDSLSEIGELLLVDFKKVEREPRQAYGKMAEELFAITRKFRDLAMNVVFIAKQELTKDEVTGRITYRPSCPGQAFTSQMPYLFDESFCMRIGKNGQETFRYLQTQPDVQYTAKDRSGKLDKSEKPNLKHIFDKIIGA